MNAIKIQGYIDIEHLEKENDALVFIGGIFGILLLILSHFLFLDNAVTRYAAEGDTEIARWKVVLVEKEQTDLSEKPHPGKRQIEKGHISIPSTKHDIPFYDQTVDEMVDGTIKSSIQSYARRKTGASHTLDDMDIVPGELQTEYVLPPKIDVFRDEGLSKARIVIPPGNRLGIQGYVYLALLLTERYTPGEHAARGLERIADGLNRYTNIRGVAENQRIHTVLDKTIETQDPKDWDEFKNQVTEERMRLYAITIQRLNQYPVLWFCMDYPLSVILCYEELNFIRTYLRSGGFMIFDSCTVGKGHHDDLVAFIRGLNYVERDEPPTNPFMVQLLEKSHPVYHAFYDIDGTADISATRKTYPGIYGIYSSQRKLCGLYIRKGLIGNLGPSANDIPLRTAINMVVYSLARYRCINEPEKNRLTYISPFTIREW